MLLLALVWRGEIDLPVTFWGGCIVLNLILLDRLGLSLVAAIPTPADSHFLVRFYTALVVLFNGFVLPSTWRSARNWTGAALWAWLARVICVFLAARIVFTFVSRW